MVSKIGDKPSAKSVTLLIQNKIRDQHMLTACCLSIWVKIMNICPILIYSNIAINPTTYITSLKTKINANNSKMNDSIARLNYTKTITSMIT